MANLRASFVVPSILMTAVAPGWVFGEEFERFAIEIIATIPTDETSADIFYVRNRVHFFDRRVVKDELKALQAVRRDRPFIEAKWHGVQLEHISLVNFQMLEPGQQQMAAAAELSKGVALLFLRDEMHSFALEMRKQWGGRRNIKVADLPEDVKKALGKRYAELGEGLRPVRQDAKTLASTVRDWKAFILAKHPILNSHPDLLEQIDPQAAPSDEDASERIMAPWQIAIEIAARETIPDYEHYSVSSDALKRAAIIPTKE
jgi:hypothetical protein